MSLALQVARWACAHEKPEWVIEPSAGRGALIKALDTVCESTVFAWEIDRESVLELDRLANKLENTSLNVLRGDFLKNPQTMGEWDLALMNPPYEGNQDVRFIEHALGCSDRVVGIFQSRILHSKGRAEFWRHHDIQRMAILSSRPRFGGEHSAKTDFIVLEITRRDAARKQGETTPTAMEWW